jgi:hypothetical protein
MKAIDDEAIAGAKQLLAFFTYQGENPIYFQKARLGGVAISGYARVRSSETNRMQIDQKASRHKRDK